MIKLMNKRIGALAITAALGLGVAAAVPGAAVAKTHHRSTATKRHDSSPDRRASQDPRSVDSTLDR